MELNHGHPTMLHPYVCYVLHIELLDVILIESLRHVLVLRLSLFPLLVFAFIESAIAAPTEVMLSSLCFDLLIDQELEHFLRA